MRLNVYKKPDEWESFYISEEDWPKMKKYLEDNNIWWTLVLQGARWQ